MSPNCAECRHCLANGGKIGYNKGNSNKGDKPDMPEDIKMIPNYVHESDMARMQKAHENEMMRVEKDKERYAKINKRLWITVIICILIIAGMFIYETQFEEVTITAEQTADGDSNNYAIGGDYFGGTSEGNYQEENP